MKSLERSRKQVEGPDLSGKETMCPFDKEKEFRTTPLDSSLPDIAFQ